MKHYSTVVSTLALFVALTMSGAYAIDKIGSKQIQNGSIRTADLHKGAVKSAKIGTGAVKSADIGKDAVETADIEAGAVTPAEVDMPEPEQLQASTASANVGTSFGFVGTLGTYTKEDPASELRVDWTGTAAGEKSCVFEVRVDGKPSGSGTGQVFVSAAGPLSVSVTSLFPELPAGSHTIEVWSRITDTNGTADGTATCTVGPAAAGIAQTVVIDEIVS
jgi:hypothetical protein